MRNAHRDSVGRCAIEAVGPQLLHLAIVKSRAGGHPARLLEAQDQQLLELCINCALRQDDTDYVETICDFYRDRTLKHGLTSDVD
jgi:hypothetical protein